MTEKPFIESVLEHGAADLSRIAGWLLDCLDRRLPPAGAPLPPSLSSPPSDRHFFASSQREAEMAQALFDAYRRELTWDGSGVGDLRYDLALAESSPLKLTL